MSDKGDEEDSDVDSNDNDDEVDGEADGEADGEVDLDDDGEVDLDDDGEIDLDGSTAGKSEKRVCKKCKQEFSKGTGVSTLKRHLNSHSINVPKKQRTLHKYRNDPHP
ncbi:6644_t:CDS:2 [Funneliformis caledonium]|uniref:6644_t:CDS:1 n=1 Tax=Funneliformis caledonium TaxID=1117310 RepID=A0A9N9DAW1_9GLOM|nr:6644_t:CDS:2 [Funneliformis caledonium]